jgi:hypothetical protein
MRQTCLHVLKVYSKSLKVLFWAFIATQQNLVITLLLKKPIWTQNETSFVLK